MKHFLQWVTYFKKDTAKPLAAILNFYLGMGLVVMTLILSVSGYYFISHVLQNALEQKAHALAEQVAITTVDAVILNEYHIIERMAEDLVKKNVDLVSIRIFNQNGQELARMNAFDRQKTGQKPPGLVIEQPLLLLSRSAGKIELVFSRDAINAPLRILSMLVAIALLFMLGGLFWVVSRLLNAHVIRPVEALSQSLTTPEKIIYQPLSVNAKLPIELQRLNQTIIDLQKRLKDHIDSLESAHKFVSDATENLCQSQRLVAVGQIAAGLAHNLNTPLANIVGYAQMAKLQTNDEPLQKRLEIIEKQAKACSQQVSNLLKTAKRPTLQLQRVDCVQEIDKVIQLMQPVVKKKSGVVLSLHAKQQAMTQLDVAAFEQLLFNLINNAIEAGATQIDFTITALLAQQNWAITICDNGSGIPSAIQSKVFEPFVTSKSTDTDQQVNGSGTGLGLFFANTLVEQMHGQLQLLKTNEQGTCFQILFPLY